MPLMFDTGLFGGIGTIPSGIGTISANTVDTPSGMSPVSIITNDDRQTGLVSSNVSSPVSESSVDNAETGGFSLSSFMKDNPGLDVEKIMEEASKHGDEYAEKYLDYLVERGELDRANAYTAEREDTAYQRLVADLKKAGLNPAMMYGSSASISSTGSQGYVKMVEGANSRSVNNYKKVKDVLLAYMKYQLAQALGIADSVFKGVSSVADVLDAVLPF